MPHNFLPEIVSIDPRHLEPLITRLKHGPKDDDSDPDKPRDNKEASLNYFRDKSNEERPYELVKTTAILRLRGYLAKRGWWCDTGFDRFADQVRFAVDDYAVENILIDAETPGGCVYGCPDCADVVYMANKRKRVITIVNDLCASCGLWVGSAAREIVVTQTGDIGSLGVYQMRVDLTEHLKKEGISIEYIRAGEQKAWGSPYLPMSDAERTVRQAEVDAIYQTFINAVAKHRGVDAGFVRENWADAKIFTGQQAVEIGLANRVASFDQVLAELVGRPVITGDSTDGDTIPGRDQLGGKRRWSGSIRRRR